VVSSLSSCSVCRFLGAYNRDEPSPAALPWRHLRSQYWVGAPITDDDGTALCERLKERGIPFVLHSGYSHVHDACLAGVVIPKPATPTELVAAIARLLRPEEGRACPV
jgi:hypothetical protein